ncbi:rRNA maturation RNase YbeY [candidate division NPL-UPA2 bacterium Unc8]|uniref:Endoribonuclease YbeY n=1 Tax=candidate division NPL-UPA2 bacterium Unc8 TaxID=1980939 RepID=A0A399G0E2_UNCN2|nr:Endoribonuclease YbeY [Bacillota bacterium]MBT9138341.1 Endoribonuclease YbeY [Bacillota bacterium]RII00992.1 MAG: rRNA maturation RNase YbeY [candidate division NPL-UPA2 bacterium Unc8]
MEVLIKNLQRAIKIEKSIIEKAARKALSCEKRQGAKVSIALVNDDRMRRLNKRYRSIDETTDVLAFAMSEGDAVGRNPELLGDVVISLPQVLKQAKKLKISFDEEVSRLLIHGILHLLGYDDQSAPQKKKMEERQEAILKELKKI